MKTSYPNAPGVEQLGQTTAMKTHPGKAPGAQAVCLGWERLIMNSSRCKRTFTRVFDIENEVHTEQSAPNVSPTSQASGQPVLGATPLQGTRRSDRFLKHAKSDIEYWRRDIDLFSESESDEEEIKGFDRIILIPRTNRSRPPRPHTSRPVPGPRATVAAVIPERSKATEADARRHAIPPSFYLDNWDPDEEPIVLLGSVFDANSLGEWIYQWSVYTYGPATPASELASILWTLITQIASNMKRAEMAMPSARKVDDKETLEDFLDSGDRLMVKLRRLLKACESPISKASNKKSQQPASISAGVEFVKILFGADKELDGLERFLHNARLWDLRFEMLCSEAVGERLPTSRSCRPTNLKSTSTSSLVDSLRPKGGNRTDYWLRPSPSRYIASFGRDAEDAVHHSQAGKSIGTVGPSSGYSSSLHMDLSSRPRARSNSLACQQPSSENDLASVQKNAGYDLVEINGVFYGFPALPNTKHNHYKHYSPEESLYVSERRMLRVSNARKQRDAFLATDLSERSPDESGDQIDHGNASISDNSFTKQLSIGRTIGHQDSETDSDDNGLGGGARIEDRPGSGFFHSDDEEVPVADSSNPRTAEDLKNRSVEDWSWISKNRREEEVNVDDTEISPERTKRPSSRLSRGSRESDWSTSVGAFHQRRQGKKNSLDSHAVRRLE